MSNLVRLRARISALEGLPSLSADRPLDMAPLGVAAIDSCLPWGGLPIAGLHEIHAENAGSPGAALGFAAFCLGRLALRRGGPLLWVSMSDDLYPPGLAACGLPVERLLLVRPARTAELLWTLEEILRCQAVAGLLGDVHGLDFTAARRLSLAARATGVPALLFNRGPPLAALLTRWQVASAASDSPVGVGAGRWRLTLTRCRSLPVSAEGQKMHWLVEMKNAADGFSLVALSQHRPALQTGYRHAG